MKNTRLLFIILLLLLTLPAYAGEDQISLFINFYNKKIYYLNQQDIYIQLSLKNNSGDTFRFYVAKNKFYNLDFDVFTTTGLQLKHSDKFIIEQQADQPAFFRELVLEPGEEYGFMVELNQFAKLETSGLLIVQALFYPELNYGENPVVIRSNKLTLNIRPPIMVKEMETLIETETGRMLQRQSLAPDEVVTYTIKARQQGQWEKFFLYLDLEKLYTNAPDRAIKYKLSSASERLLLLEKYKNQLKENRAEQDILMIPHWFEVVRTEYNQTDATVIVTMKFEYRDFTEINRYTYYLEKKDRFWLITRYVVGPSRTE